MNRVYHIMTHIRVNVACKIFFKHAKLEHVTKFGTRECGNANLGTRKKSFEKARGNAEREEEMKERGHVSREGPAGTRAQLWSETLLCRGLTVFKDIYSRRFPFILGDFQC